MLKISSKRGREWAGDLDPNMTPPCSPLKITSLDSTPSKKLKPIDQQGQGFVFESSVRTDSPFPTMQTEVQENVEQLLANKQRKQKAKSEVTEKMFSYN